MKISIRIAKASDLKDYTNLLQKTYEFSYTNQRIGLTKDFFSKEIFLSVDTQKYLKSNLVINRQQKTWIALLNSKLIGSITIIDKGKDCELRGFYVYPEFQGQGIGKQLWEKALAFSEDKDIVLDIYAHNLKTIDMYLKWGFIIDKDRGTFYRHWPEWPKGIQAKCIYMRLVK
jgi:ribosomal protein S18 acetylase RimI-like enzyme